MTPSDTWASGAEALADRVGKRFKTSGVVLVDKAAAAALHIEKPWTTYAGNPRVYLGVLDDMDADACPLLHEGWHQDTAAAFELFHELLGVPWHRSGGVAGLELLQSLYPKGKTKPLQWESGQPERAEELSYFPDDWARKPDGKFVHGYDKRRAGLAALNTVEVARMELRHLPKKTFDPGMAGWWLIEAPEWQDARMPDPIGYGPRQAGGHRVWVTTPTMVLLDELAEAGVSQGARYVFDAWVAPKSRIFLRWADRVEKAIQRAEQLMALKDPERLTLAPNGDLPKVALATDAERVRDALSGVYRETHGMFTAATSWVKRHDWYAAGVAMNRANMWRSAWAIGQKTGRWPVRVDGDKWWYASDSEDGEAAAPTYREGEKTKGIVLGNSLGTWRHQGTRIVKGQRGE